MSGFNYDLSAEAALECTSYYAPNQRVSDCSGGYFVDPLNFISKVGSVLRSTYPYAAYNYGSVPGYPSTPGICSEQNRIYLGAGTVNLYASGLTAIQIKTLLYTYGPLMIGLYANSPFLSYSGGVFTGCPADSASYINHAIVLYGWDSSGNWLVRNQWGTSWGSSGDMVLSSVNDCGMSQLIGFVSVANKNSQVQVIMNPGYSW